MKQKTHNKFRTMAIFFCTIGITFDSKTNANLSFIMQYRTGKIFFMKHTETSMWYEFHFILIRCAQAHKHIFIQIKSLMLTDDGFICFCCNNFYFALFFIFFVFLTLFAVSGFSNKCNGYIYNLQYLFIYHNHFEKRNFLTMGMNLFWNFNLAPSNQMWWWKMDVIKTVLFISYFT